MKLLFLSLFLSVFLPKTSVLLGFTFSTNRFMCKHLELQSSNPSNTPETNNGRKKNYHFSKNRINNHHDHDDNDDDDEDDDDYDDYDDDDDGGNNEYLKLILGEKKKKGEKNNNFTEMIREIKKEILQAKKEDTEETEDTFSEREVEEVEEQRKRNQMQPTSGIHIIFQGIMPPQLNADMNENMNTNMNTKSRETEMDRRRNMHWNHYMQNGGKDRKSENFEVIVNHPFRFTDIGGYENVKSELMQCVDILKNYEKYSKYNVRIPKGLILEGPPGNGKTLLAKAFAGECNVSFIAVSGSEFQEKYVGVGSSRVRELFALAKKNVPCIVFIDEIDAIGRTRSSDGETSSSERDNTLNELLVAMDGFKNNKGIFLIGATNRADLLDPALMRPGRIDKRIFIGLPDEKTRKAILDIHIQGKPYDESGVIFNDLVDTTSGLSGAQIENLLNEAMLNALRYNREKISKEDMEIVLNKIMVGWQPNQHQFSEAIMNQILIHEMGHAVMGMVSKNHSKMRKVIINLSSPNTPGYTLFEQDKDNIYTREGLLEHLSILLGGRIAEEIFYGIGSVSSGAINDFEEALKLAQKMVIYYGMGNQLIYPSLSEKYKEIIDNDVSDLIQTAYNVTYSALIKQKKVIMEGVNVLKKDGILEYTGLEKIMDLDINSK